MPSGYREYLELFEYFGRGGMVRLSREAFEALDAEFRRLVSQGPLESPELVRVEQLKRLLLRDRPRASELACRRADRG